MSRAADPILTTEALTALIEMQAQAPFDLCGEQRDWYLPRLNKVFAWAASTFPSFVLTAMENAKDPYGEPLVTED